MGDRATDERLALLALLLERPRKLSWPAIATEVVERGSAIDFWNELHPAALDGMDSQGADYLAAARTDLERWADTDFELVTVLDPSYPVSLRGIHELPPLLFVRGRLDPHGGGVSVVGSREATERGISIASHVARGLVDRGLAVISGLAAGIDTAAHTAALDAGGFPVGVIGTGINLAYPAANRELHARVAANGALVSQFLPDAPATKYQFPMRNAVMSGIGQVSVVIEAGERSGARIQARVAVEHGRPVILTDLVVEATSWARELSARPGVHVASSTAEVMKLVERLVSTDVRAVPVPQLAAPEAAFGTG